MMTFKNNSGIRVFMESSRAVLHSGDIDLLQTTHLVVKELLISNGFSRREKQRLRTRRRQLQNTINVPPGHKASLVIRQASQHLKDADKKMHKKTGNLNGLHELILAEIRSAGLLLKSLNPQERADNIKEVEKIETERRRLNHEMVIMARIHKQYKQMTR